MVGKTGVAFFAVGLLACLASADTITRVMVLNSNPEVKAILVTSGVQLGEGVKTDVWCNTTIKDKNGVLDLNATVIVLYNKKHSSADGETSALYNYKPKLKYIDVVDQTTSNISAFFTLTDNAVGGKWACSVTTVDNDGESDSAEAEFRIYSKECLNKVRDASEDEIDCGGGKCVDCVEVKTTDVEVRAGKEAKMQLTMVSHSQENAVIKEVAGDAADGIEITVGDAIGELLPGEVINSNAVVSVERSVEAGTHLKKITVKTESGLVSEGEILVNVMPLPAPALAVQLQSGCANEVSFIRIADNDTGAAVESASVRISVGGKKLQSLLTDEFGEIAFTPSDTGVYVIDVSKEGYPNQTKMLSVLRCAGEKRALTLEIEGDGGMVGESRVIVVRRGDGSPVKAVVTIKDPGGAVESFSSDVNGKALVGFMREGVYTITAAKSGYEPVERNVTAAPSKKGGPGVAYYVVLIMVAAALAVFFALKKKGT